jgi:hypothetical protein
MSEQLTAWIRRVAALNDVDLEEELSLINKNSLNAFARALSRIRRPELDSHSYRNGTYEAHPHADTINLLLSIGESTLSAINSETPVSPVPYGVSPHMDVNARIKVLTRQNRANYSGGSNFFFFGSGVSRRVFFFFDTLSLSSLRISGGLILTRSLGKSLYAAHKALKVEYMSLLVGVTVILVLFFKVTCVKI